MHKAALLLLGFAMTCSGGALSLSNASIAAAWEVRDGHFRQLTITDRRNARVLTAPPDAFAITIAEGRPIKASEMTVTGQPQIEKLAGGGEIQIALEDSGHNFSVAWRGILRDGSSYIRQEVTLRANTSDLPITSVRLIDMDLPDARISGTVKGSPIVSGNMFLGLEHPLSESEVSHGRAIANISRELPLRAGHSVTYSSVIGATPPGGLRRGFLEYLERERAHPYRTFLHYNTWYDLGYFSRYDEAGALNRIDAFGTELARKRGVTLDSLMFDDGWDDPATLWNFNSGFPDGFTRVREAAAKYGFAPGVWLSPWGGYGKPKQQRLEFGRKEGFETNEGGFALSGPKYYRRFHYVCLDMMRRYGVNQFKIDGTGNVNEAITGSQFDSDFAAAIALIGDLRAQNPEVYINLTSGTYPSPFWLRYADSIWRGGDDHTFAGVGSWRERWITYRDADTYQGIVQSGPLFPLNSLMLHGIIYARHARHLDTDPGGDFTHEVHDYFGTGTQLQELYITPSLLSEKDWDVLAEAAKWSRENAPTLKDTHWIGGDPAMLEVYGWAAWSSAKGILTLRNPSDKPQTFGLDAARAFELPPGAARSYPAASPWIADRGRPSLTLTAGQPSRIQLQPFEVLTLEAIPAAKESRRR